MAVAPFVVHNMLVVNRLFLPRAGVTPVAFTIAFSFMGDIITELIKPINSAPSPYSEFLGSGREGLHHIGFWPEDFDRTCTALALSGFKEVSSICRSDGTKDVIYCDTPPAVGIMVELAQMNPVRT